MASVAVCVVFSRAGVAWRLLFYDMVRAWRLCDFLFYSGYEDVKIEDAVGV